MILLLTDSRTYFSSGFVHSAFTFAYESSIAKNACKNADVPPGALITFLQKGLQYLGIEENLNEDGSERKRKKRRNLQGNTNRNASGGSDDESEPSPDLEKFSLLSPHACRALGRKNPPIRLNVPPATATAAVTAKVAAEQAAQAKNKGKKNGDYGGKRNVSNALGNTEQHALSSKNQYPQYQTHTNLSPGRTNQSATNFNAVAAAAAMRQLHEQGKPVTPSIPTMGAGGASFVGARQVNMGTLPLTNNAGMLHAGQSNPKPSDNFIAALANRNNTMAEVPGYKPRKNKNKPTAPIPGAMPQTNAIPKQTQGFHSLPGSFPNQNSFPGALDAAKVGDNGSQQRVQALMTVAAANALAGNPAMNMRPQNTVVGVDTNRNLQGNNNLIQNVIANSTLNVKNRGAISQLDNFRNAPVPGRPVYGNGAQPTPQLPTSSHNISQPNAGIDQNGNLDDTPTQILPSEIVELSKHTSEVFMCSWNQVYPYLIATGSGDASARIWQMNGPTSKSGCGNSKLLKHGNPTDKNKDVTTLGKLILLFISSPKNTIILSPVFPRLCS